MKAAIVHDYLYTYGGAERVLEALVEMYPEATVYVSWVDWKWLKANKPEWKRWNLGTTWFQWVPFKKVLTSPLRFLAPWVWNSLDLREYDLIISSSAWFVTRGFLKKKKGAKEICYCHTPPRYLYGFETSREWKKNWLVRVYATIVNPFMRFYDFRSAKRVDQFVTNSENTRRRIDKFYRRKAKVIFPPVRDFYQGLTLVKNLVKNGDYYLMVNRLVRMKRIDVAIEAMRRVGCTVNLKIVGTGPDEKRLKELARGLSNIEFLGYVDDKKLSQLYARCKAVIYLARDEDFGITPVEAMQHGRPVIGIDSGGVRESVIDGKTGVLMEKGDAGELVDVIKKNKVRNLAEKDIKKQAEKFSRRKFKKEFGGVVELVYGKGRT